MTDRYNKMSAGDLFFEVKRLVELRQQADSQCRRAQAERDQARRERDAAARQVACLAAEREAAMKKIAELDAEGETMKPQDMIWAVYEGAETNDPIAVFSAPWHASAFARLDDERLVGRLDNEGAVRLRPQPSAEQPPEADAELGTERPQRPRLVCWIRSPLDEPTNHQYGELRLCPETMLPVGDTWLRARWLDEPVQGRNTTMKTAPEIARATHEMNRLYCSLLGDDSQSSWEDAPDWQRRSAIAGVRAVLSGTATTPEEQHEQWMQQKVADGWVSGTKKDADLKTHPCLVPYDELPAEQQAKDAIFRAVVAGLRSAS